ncbi:DUF2339 domain-containing protein [Sinisalibacter lacisalsi]|uniref:DUF2339 domain-containing protein n=1 Tax=Sinisalibacter lacisalsi TaxID=1526570 RepID=A0ABQ1QPM9_9RHOB|nr:DUF2339 domain-containing protein [Sinisalibacter lacisalsi]GGD35319.1 hypothetical protein GCM10011358_19120 [Sinisalibacter lacisalsi]
MDALIALMVLAGLALPVLLIVVTVWTVGLAKRVRALETALEALRGQAGVAPEAAPGRDSRQATPREAAATQAPATSEAAEPEPAAAKAPDRPDSPPRAVVLRADKARALLTWLKANWIYAVSAISLAFAGLYFVEYGIETGLLTPSARVIAALVFGAGLVLAGEYIRRRWGDTKEATTAYLPSVFSGAGIVTLFLALLAALHLYALIGPGTALAGLVAVAALAIVLGWYSGPLLAAVGLTGAFVAPFLVGGESDIPQAFYGYFALIALAGLAIDAVRRWAWVSVLTLALAFPAGWLLFLGAGYPEFFVAFLAGLVAASMAVPVLSLSPAHRGAAIVEAFAKGRPRGWPAFPTRLVAASMAVASGSLVLVSLDSAGAFWIAAIALVALVFAVAVWADRAEALEDLAALPALGLVALAAAQALDGAPAFRAFRATLTAPEGTPVPQDPILLVALAALASLAAAWRARRGARWPVAWAAGAALTAPAMLAALETLWRPAQVLGAYPWALTATALAAMMTALALAFARVDGASKARAAGFVLAAFALIAFALSLILTTTALTLAFAALTLAAATLDRRFAMPALGAVVQAGAVLMGWRLVIDPGLPWAEHAPYWELVLGYGGAVGALVAALVLLRPLARPKTVMVAESAAWSLAAVFASVLLMRIIEDAAPGRGTETHWAFGLLATIWLTMAAAQLWRMQTGGMMARVRRVLAAIYGLIGLVALAVALGPLNPLVNGGANTQVLGPIALNTLLPAYLLPGAVLALIAARFAFLGLGLRRVIGTAASVLAAVWLFLAIRHAWRGDAMNAAGFTDPELYSYTIALLVIGAGLLYQAIARRSGGLRKLAMAVIALTVAKVFLVDASGLVGLLRVASFLALGLALAGLAFLNRWAAGRTGAAP